MSDSQRTPHTPHPSPYSSEPTAARRYDAWYDSSLGAVCLERELTLLRGTGAFSERARVLEAGCGTGRFLTAIPCDPAASAGVDQDETRLSLARRRAEGLGLALPWMAADAHALPFADGGFDVVFEVTLLCFVEDAEAVIREIVRVCRPGGHVLLGELSPTSPWQWWRGIKARFGRGSFVGARLHRPGELGWLLEKAGCPIEGVGRAIFFPPIPLPGPLLSSLDRLGHLLCPWAGAFYVIHGRKPRTCPPKL